MKVPPENMFLVKVEDVTMPLRLKLNTAGKATVPFNIFAVAWLNHGYVSRYSLQPTNDTP